MNRKPALIFGNMTDTGLVRTENQDYYGRYVTLYGELLVLCDGMGGHNGGSVASRLAVETIRRYIVSSVGTDTLQVLSKAVEDASGEIWRQSKMGPGLAGMGTTCVALILETTPKPKAYWASVGDSRIYLIRRNVICQLTDDHSRVMDMFRRGLITKDETRDHPEKNIITRALGIAESIKVDVGTLDLCKGDRLLLCSDGICGPVRDEEMVTLSAKATPQEFSERLVALANSRGGDDNSTVQVVDVRVGPRAMRVSIEEDVPTLRSVKRRVFVGLSLLLVCAIVVWLLFKPANRDLGAKTQATTEPGTSQSVTELPVRSPGETPHEYVKKQGDTSDDHPIEGQYTPPTMPVVPAGSPGNDLQEPKQKSVPTVQPGGAAKSGVKADSLKNKHKNIKSGPAKKSRPN